MLEFHGECCCRPTPTRILNRIAGMAFNFSATQFDRLLEPGPEPSQQDAQPNRPRSSRSKLATSAPDQPKRKVAS